MTLAACVRNQDDCQLGTYLGSHYVSATKTQYILTLSFWKKTKRSLYDISSQDAVSFRTKFGNGIPLRSRFGKMMFMQLESFRSTNADKRGDGKLSKI